MATVPTQCPNCHQQVPAQAQVCPHCNVYLQLPARPGSLPQPVQTQQGSGLLSPAGLAESLPEALKQLDAAATTNITISGVLIAFYAGAIFAGKVQASQAFNAIVYASPIVLLLLAIIFSVRVFYSTGYLTDDYVTLLKKKEERMRYSSLLLELSVGLLAVSVFVYLMRS